MNLDYSNGTWTLTVWSLVLYRGRSLEEARDAADLYAERTLSGVRPEVADGTLPPRDLERDEVELVEMQRVFVGLSACDLDLDIDGVNR